MDRIRRNFWQSIKELIRNIRLALRTSSGAVLRRRGPRHVADGFADRAPAAPDLGRGAAGPGADGLRRGGRGGTAGLCGPGAVDRGTGAPDPAPRGRCRGVGPGDRRLGRRAARPCPGGAAYRLSGAAVRRA